MSITLPVDGNAIYDTIAPSQGRAVWGPRLDRIRAGGFRLVMNYHLLVGSTADMVAYINYAASIGLKVIVCTANIQHSANLSTSFPTLYVEAGSPGIGDLNDFTIYVVNQVKGLAGTWGYYVSDEAADADHTTVKAMHD